MTIFLIGTFGLLLIWVEAEVRRVTKAQNRNAAIQVNRRSRHYP